MTIKKIEATTGATALLFFLILLVPPISFFLFKTCFYSLSTHVCIRFLYILITIFSCQVNCLSCIFSYRFRAMLVVICIKG